MNVGSKLHDMVTSDSFTAGEWSDPADLPPHIVSAKGSSLTDSERKQPGPAPHPLQSGDVMLEDTFACERVQRGLESSRSGVGTLSIREALVAFFQKQVANYVRPAGSTTADRRN